ncbi:hypothetical protein TNCV_1896201 [Trichonephila clavipes]|nr:hypothetical protein TNCV_1896201 [Trichonephila clavipes]
MPRAHQGGFSRRSLAGVGFFESARSHGPGVALLENGGGQQQKSLNHASQMYCLGYIEGTRAHTRKWEEKKKGWICAMDNPSPVLRVEQSTLTSHPVRNVRLKDTRENMQMDVRDAKL